MAFISDNFYSEETSPIAPSNSESFKVTKRCLDILAGSLLLVAAIIVGSALLILNPFWNSGSLLYAQRRMGKNCKPFTAYKFRSMVSGDERNVSGELEINRITPLGRLIRAFRIDEIPQGLNILRGEMSLIGPRPDFLPHAKEYLETVPGYRGRYNVRPGLTGQAQISIGYVDTLDGVRAKVAADLNYIHNRSLFTDFKILGRTVGVILRAEGK